MSIPSRPALAAWAPCRFPVKTAVVPARTGSGAGLGIAGQSEDPLTDDVALDLARPPGDRQTARREKALAPPAGVVLGGGAARPELPEPELPEPPLVFGAEQTA